MPKISYKHVVWFQSLLLWGCLVLLLDETILDKQGQVLLAALTWLIALTYVAHFAGQGVFSLTASYLALLGLVHLALIVPASLGIEPKIWWSWLDSPYLPKAVNLSAVAFAFFGVGVSLAKVRHKANKFAAANGNEDDVANGKTARPLLLGGLGLAIIGLTMLAVGAVRWGLFSMTYLETYVVRWQTDPRLIWGGMRFALIGLVTAATAADKRQIRYIAWLSIVIMGPVFLFGFRRFLVLLFIALLVVWHRKDERSAKLVAAVGIIAVLILAPTVRMLRGQRTVALGEAVSTVSILDVPMEAGYSLRTLVETLAEIQHTGGHWYGRSYLSGLKRVVPYTSLSWEPAEERKGSPPVQTPTSWIAQLVDPRYFSLGGSFGYSGVAEPYLNFGLPGVILFFAGLGYLLTRIEPLSQRDVYLKAAVMCAFVALLSATRSDFTLQIRPAVWSVAFVYAIKVLVSWRRWQEPRKRGEEQVNLPRVL